MHNNCLRICLKADRLESRVNLYSASGIRPLIEQRAINTYSFVNKGVNNQSTAYINNMFSEVSNSHARLTRSSNNGILKVPFIKLEKWKSNIRIRGANLFNNIPSHIRDHTTLKTLMPNLRVHVEQLGILDISHPRLYIIEGKYPLPPSHAYQSAQKT